MDDRSIPDQAAPHRDTRVSLSDVLDRVRITTVDGATFDAGEINIAYI